MLRLCFGIGKKKRAEETPTPVVVEGDNIGPPPPANGGPPAYGVGVGKEVGANVVEK